MVKISVNLKKPLDQWGPIDAHILYVSFWFWSVALQTKKLYGVLWPDLIGMFQKNRLTFIWETKKMQEQGQSAIKKWLLNEKNFKRLRKDYKKTLADLSKISKEVNKIDLSNKNQVTALVTRLYKELTLFWTITTVFELANYGAPNFLRRKIKKYFKESEIDNALEILLTPEDLSFHQKEELVRLKFYIESKNKTDLSRKLNHHAKKWHWINNSYYNLRNLSAINFQKMLAGMPKSKAKIEIKKIEKYSQNNLKRKLSLKKAHNLPQSIMKISNRLAFSIWWQDERKGKAWEYLPWIKTLNKFAQKLYGTKEKDILLYTAKEWLRLFKTGKKLNSKELTNRRKLFAAITGKERCILDTKKSTEKFIAKAISQHKRAKSKVIKGTVVSKGNGKAVRGTVKILLNPKLTQKIKKGDILVAPMTSPDFVPAMRRAKAVITDVGGLMSHAAVVSREMNLPCVVGTKIATKTLKNGKLVEIDTKKGVIKIL